MKTKQNKAVQKLVRAAAYLIGAEYETKMLNTAALAVISGLFSALYKLLFGLYLSSAMWLFSAAYSLCIAASKFLFAKCIVEKRGEEDRRKTALRMTAILIVTGYLFNLFMLIRQTRQPEMKQLPLWIVVLLSLWYFYALVMAVRGVVLNSRYHEYIYSAYKGMILSGSLMNLVLLQRMVLSYLKIDLHVLYTINSIFGYLVGASLALIATILLLRFRGVKRETGSQ